MNNPKIRILISLIGHLLMVGVITFLLWQIFSTYYLNNDHPVGSDFYNSLTYAHYFQQNPLRFPADGWEYFWYRGLPTAKAYQWLHFYLMQPLVGLTDVFSGMEIYSALTLGLFFLFSYFLYFEISQSRALALFLTVILIYSRGVFDGLFAHAFINASATQFFLPASLYFAVKFLKNGNLKFLLISGVLTGLAFLGHQLVGGFLTAIPIAIFLFLRKGESGKFFSFQRLEGPLILALVALLVAAPTAYETFRQAVGQSGICTTCQWTLSDIKDFPNPLSLVLPFFFGFIWLLSFLGKRKMGNLLLPSLAIFGYFTFMVISVVYSIKPFVWFSGPVWPSRVVWAWSLGAGLVCASFFSSFKDNFQLEKKRFVLPITSLFFLIAVLGIGLLKPPFLIPDYQSFQVPPLAYPVNIHLYLPGKYNRYPQEKLFPSWLPFNEQNWRFDDRDNAVIFWWNIASRLPVENGSSNVVPLKINDWHAWLNAALTGEFLAHGRSERGTLNTTLFLIDWHAINYLGGKEPTYADYLVNNPEVIDKQETVSSGLGDLAFSKIKDGISSPILQATKTPVVYIVSRESGYLNILKNFALLNLNSQKIIPIQGPDSVGKINNEDLKIAEAVILYDYLGSASKQEWEKLKEYVKSGGTLIIDTGSEVAESESDLLPEPFPVTATSWEALGREWQLEFGNHFILKEVDFTAFSPLVFENDSWKLASAVSGDSTVRPWAQTLLSQDGHPLLVAGNLGRGKVVWSGMNLFYHAFYYDNLSEAKLIENILDWSFGLKSQNVNFQANRPFPEKVSLTSDEPVKGVLFKENFEKGWIAKADSKKLKIYPAGPGFMYVGLSGKASSVELYYRGSSFIWFLFFLSFFTLLIVFEYLVFNGRLFSAKIVSLLKKRALVKISGWWEKEE